MLAGVDVDLQRRRPGQPPRVDARPDARPGTQRHEPPAVPRDDPADRTRGRDRADLDAPGVRPPAVPARRRTAPDEPDRRERRRQAGVRTVPPRLRQGPRTAGHRAAPHQRVRAAPAPGPRRASASCPVFVRRALAGDEIELFGDGSQLRDCLHVDDIVDALLLAASTPATRGRGVQPRPPEVLPLSEIARLTIAAAGSASTVSLRAVAGRARTDRHRELPGRLRQGTTMLGWTPQVAFADGIASTLAYVPGRA